MSEQTSNSERPYGGAGDSRAGTLTVADRFRRHAEMLAASDRSPLYVVLMRDAADDLHAGGVVADLMDGVDAPPGAVPQLRLLAALHELVLSGRTPYLAHFYPSAGGSAAPGGAWAAAAEAMRANFDWIKVRMTRTVQTNEPGRSAVLFAVLLWLTDRHRLPVRLLEIGASAGINLLPDRYCYVHDGDRLGDPASAVRFEQPWSPPPPIALREAADRLEISYRAGCDLAPLDPRDPADRLRLLSYIWPDEPARIARLQDALSVAAQSPARVECAPAGEWLPDALAQRGGDQLTVVWHSVVRQYLGAPEWAELERTIAQASAADPRRPIVFARMEPAWGDGLTIEVTLRSAADDRGSRLAICGDHGPPVHWHAVPG